MPDFKEIIGIIGGVLGAIAFFWKIGDAIVAYLHLDLKIEEINSADDLTAVTALTTIENKGSLAKPLHYAVLLITPEGEDYESSAKAIVGEICTDEEKKTSDHLHAIFQKRLDQSFYSNDKRRALIPLAFYYRDQQQIGNEVIKYRCSIDVEKLENEKSYTAIFFVFIRYPLGILRWRATSDLLKTK